MKNEKDINNSLSNIKKALREEKETPDANTENNNFFLLENVIEKKVLSKTNNVDIENIKKAEDQKLIGKVNAIKKNKSRKVKTENSKKQFHKQKPVEIVIDKEVRPIIQKWIKKNLRSFVKRVVVEEFKAISKVAFKQSSASK